MLLNEDKLLLHIDKCYRYFISYLKQDIILLSNTKYIYHKQCYLFTYIYYNFKQLNFYIKNTQF